jgi:hypothetical protein
MPAPVALLETAASCRGPAVAKIPQRLPLLA